MKVMLRPTRRGGVPQPWQVTYFGSSIFLDSRYNPFFIKIPQKPSIIMEEVEKEVEKEERKTNSCNGNGGEN